MQIQTANKEELGLLIMGLESIYVADQEKLLNKLLEQLRTELSTRYGLKLSQRKLQLATD